MRLGFGSIWLRSIGAGCAVVLAVAVPAGAQSEVHGRKYKPMPPTAHIVVTVEKGFNGKPMQNAAVIFHAVRNGVNDGNLEVKTDPDGKAAIDVIEIGSKVTIQVIANGFATYAQDVSIDEPTLELLVKMQRPRAQISDYVDNDGKPSQVKPGVQEHIVPKPANPPPATPPATQPSAPPDGTQR
jgi:hypothetical protein